MIYLAAFFCGLVLMNVLVMRRVRDIAGAVKAAILVAAALTAIYQLFNFVYFGGDPFILIAAAVQFLVAFLASVVFGIVFLKVRARVGA